MSTAVGIRAMLVDTRSGLCCECSFTHRLKAWADAVTSAQLDAPPIALERAKGIVP
jgi:hypothetical protein